MKKRLIISTLLVLLAGGASGGVLYLHNKNKPVINSQIQHSVGFTIFVPKKDQSNWLLDKKSVHYDDKVGVLYTNLVNTTNKITMTQQNLPSPFTDIPNYQGLFYGKLNEYQELNLPLGTVGLTRPTELKGGQSAVANIKGTLMFLHPDKDLSDDEWKIVFSSLQTL